jgi:hypothetical protein
MLPCGYTWLIERFQLPHFPLNHASYIGGTRSRTTDAVGHILEIFPDSYWPGDEPLDHLVFGLKYDGVELALLASLFPRLDSGEIGRWVDHQPTSKYTRIVGFLYEYLLQRSLPVADRQKGNYVEVLDSERYITAPKPLRIERWRVNHNLLGSSWFCPTVRRTSGVENAVDLTVQDRLESLKQQYPLALFQRALDYAYYKETHSSYAIEREQPTPPRTERFVALLHDAGRVDLPWNLLFAETGLTPLQNAIVEERYRESGFRTVQNYVGQQRGLSRMRIHYVCPPPYLVDTLIRGLALCALEVEIPPVVKAALLSFGFVFIHPFEDGNGRLHRFLIHDTLVRTGFVPEGLLLPVSAVMLRKQEEYDRALERFSLPLLRLADYTLSPEAELTLQNAAELEPFYRFPDLTFAVEYLALVIQESVEQELADELHYLESYDIVREAIRKIVDMPDKKLDLLLNLLRANDGQLSKRKREVFAELHDDELRQIETAFQENQRRGQKTPQDA